MDSRVRIALLAGGLLFCATFAAMTIAVAVRSSVDIFTLISLGIVGIVATGLIGALRHPPEL